MRDSIGLLTIDNPPRNCLADPDFLEIDDLMRWISDPALKGIIVTGTGRHFSAGADLDALGKLARDHGRLLSGMRRGKEILSCLERAEVPTVAAIEGACFGGGLEIALACHIRVCGETSIFAFPEVNHGLVPGMGGTVRLPALSGLGRAMHMILGGDTIDAERARSMQLVDYIAPSRKVLNFSFELMKKMVDGRTVEVVRSVVRSLNNALVMDIAEAMESETRIFCDLARKLFGDDPAGAGNGKASGEDAIDHERTAEMGNR